RQLRQSQEEVGEIVSGHGAVKRKAASRVRSGVGLEVGMPIITAKAEIVFAMEPGERFASAEGLIQTQRRPYVVQCAVICERQGGQSPIEWIFRNARYAECARNILLVREKVGGGGVVAVVAEIGVRQDAAK